MLLILLTILLILFVEDLEGNLTLTIRSRVKGFIGKAKDFVGGLSSPKTETITILLDEVTIAARMKQVMTALSSNKYEWRSMERLVYLSGLPQKIIMEKLLADPNVVLMTNKKGIMFSKLKKKADFK